MSSRFLITLTVLAAAATAQMQKVVPIHRTSSEGNTQSYVPFLYDVGRHQVVVDGGAFSLAVAQITEIRMRRDGPGNPFNPVMFPSSTITVSYAANGITPATMSQTFANNRGANATVIYTGALNLPALPVPGAPPAPFAIKFPFASPYLYLRQNGDLLIEFELGMGQAQQKQEYFMDAEQYNAAAGTVVRYGASGSMSGGDILRTSAATTGLAPGGNAVPTLTGMRANYGTVLHWLGASRTNFNGIPLPFDLAGVGAPGNNIYASIALLVVANITGSASNWQANHNWQIPNDASLGNAILFGQFAVFHAPSNNLGWVFSEALQMTLAPASGAAIMNSVMQSDTTSTTGSFQYGANTQGGPILELVGVFG
jgi:hypothetical protein